MGFNCGIVGLPNVGKSTLFNALTNAGSAAANYPFCTIEPNVGVVAVPDKRLQSLAEFFAPDKITPTSIEFVDIAGLVRGASKGEGLGNQFLGHIRNVDAIAHVVRCFDDADVVHVAGHVNPLEDMAVIETELVLADIEAVQKRLERNAKLLRSGDKKIQEQCEVLEKLQPVLDAGQMATQSGLGADDFLAIRDLFLITAKPFFYVCNVDEASLKIENPYVQQVKTRAKVPVVTLCGKIEAEIAELSQAERVAFLSDYGLNHSGLEFMAKTGYDLLNLITYFTAGKQEVRAWTIKNGTLAPQAAGVIHSDFERGFIKAEVYHIEDLLRLKSVAKVRESGLFRMEGRDYLVKDGDVMLFKFNV